ncbi:LTA synthase family protein [Paenibacillus sp. JX-17]|uniref:LTA synthase family protein n=1 Tax=Paenibacillus lacisoli TaxID=3064525 RepID=A0ABT9CAF8_9BACL|nr:LTA synthase family protein [Paenibacillus sp. JX-17]MDO7905634.1 LTA synthase family protein [Paenibacillus sp. JX-17]
MNFSNHSRSYMRTLYYTVFVLLLLKMILLRVFFFNEIKWTHLLADGLAVLVLMSIIELLVPARWKGPSYWAFNLIFSLLLFAATLFNEHYGSIPTYTALGELNQVPQIRGTVNSLIRPEYFLFFLDVLIMAVIWVVSRIRGRSMRAGRRPVNKIAVSVILVISLLVSIRYIIQGGNIENELVQAENVGFLDYQIASVLRENKEDREIAAGNIQKIIQDVQKLQSTYKYQEKSGQGNPLYFGQAEGKNVIVVQMEAFQNFMINRKVDNQEITPVLNQLVKESLYFPNIYQQIGQGNTSDAEFMSNTSIYPRGNIAMSTGFGDRQLPSLPKLLERSSYETNTFHVNDVTFWDRIKLYPALGFDQYYDKPNYTNDHFNDFGASDEELYRVGVEKLRALQDQRKPFYAQFVTVSSHAPFRIPDDRKRMKMPAGLDGTLTGDYLTAQNYTDYALGTLIQKLKDNGMWDNTVLVAYGDHFGLPKDTDPAALNETLNMNYDDHLDRFNIPLVIHLPGQKEGKVINRTGGQLDIMPTLANLLGVSLKNEKFTAFGHDLLNIDHNVFGMRYYLPSGSFFNDDILFIPGEGFEDGSAVSLKTRQPVTNLEPYRKDYDYVMSLMKLSDQYVKLLPKRK